MLPSKYHNRRDGTPYTPVFDRMTYIIQTLDQ
jgi:hypothetical protein